MDDQKIIGLFFERSQRAVKELSGKYFGYCKKISMNILSNESDAEECVNDAFLKVWDSVPPNRPERLGAYVGAITRNISLNRLNSNRAAKRFAGFELLLDELSEVIPSNDSTDNELDRAELAGAINSFLGTLDERTRALFVSRYWFGDSIRDISKSFGINENTVKTVLFRTRNRLKKHLESEDHNI